MKQTHPVTAAARNSKKALRALGFGVSVRSTRSYHGDRVIVRVDSIPARTEAICLREMDTADGLITELKAWRNAVGFVVQGVIADLVGDASITVDVRAEMPGEAEEAPCSVCILDGAPCADCADAEAHRTFAAFAGYAGGR